MMIVLNCSLNVSNKVNELQKMIMEKQQMLNSIKGVSHTDYPIKIIEQKENPLIKEINEKLNSFEKDVKINFKNIAELELMNYNLISSLKLSIDSLNHNTQTINDRTLSFDIKLKEMKNKLEEIEKIKEKENTAHTIEIIKEVPIAKDKEKEKEEPKASTKIKLQPNQVHIIEP